MHLLQILIRADHDHLLTDATEFCSGAMTASASKLTKILKLKGTAKVDNKALAAGALTARTNLSSESADNGVNLEVLG